MEHTELILRLVIAAGLGSLIGFERERLVWAAGLRTHMLVCVGACLIMIVSAYGFNNVLGPNIVLDPSRVAAQVVSGIGFLGAGSILLRGNLIRGLTTAASLWTVAGIGLAVGGGLYIEAGSATVIILVILAGIKPLENWYQSRSATLNVRMRVNTGKVSMENVCRALGYPPHRISRFSCTPVSRSKQDEIHLSIRKLSQSQMDEILTKLTAMPEVRHAVRVTNSDNESDLRAAA